MPANFLTKGLSLRRRIVLLSSLGVFVVLGAMGAMGYLSVREMVDGSLRERLLLAQNVAGRLDYIMDQNLIRLQDVSFAPGFDLEDSQLDAEQLALHRAYLNSIFTAGVFLLDERGVVILREPYRSGSIGDDFSRYPHVKESLASGKPVVSSLHTLAQSGDKVVTLLVPIKGWESRILGLVGGDIDPTNSRFQELLKAVKVGEGGYIDLVDDRGVVLASTMPGHVLEGSDHGSYLSNLIKEKRATVRTCHRCHEGEKVSERETEVLAFSPLSQAPWGVSIRQAERETLAPARAMTSRFLLFSIPLIAVAMVLARKTAKSITGPIETLTDSAQSISRGDLSKAIPFLGEDEIGRLGLSFDLMRVKLKDLLDQVRLWNRELEEKVRQRTSELEASQTLKGELLKKVISAQEEERKRIARELHDETSQALVALMMSIDSAAAEPGEEDNRKRFEQMKELVANTLDGVHGIIYDLRPSLLDDLGLQAAIRWYGETRLEALGINFSFHLSGAEIRLPGDMETVLFRAVQEAITNIVRHAEAENVEIRLDFREKGVSVTVEDNGRGFDLESITNAQGRRDGGLGLLGMRERVSLLGGALQISSRPGGGAKIAIEVPYSNLEAA